MTSRSRSESAYTLIELLMVIVLMAVLAGTSLELISDSLDESRYEQTAQKMEKIKQALVGDPLIKENASRTSFGYVGDVGEIPSLAQGLSALLSMPGTGVSAYAVDATARFAAGWSGAYISGDLKDGWGRSLIYEDDGLGVRQIVSSGSDGLRDPPTGTGATTGFAKDLVVQLPTTIRQGTVSGFVSRRGGPPTTTYVVKVYYPVGGSISTATTTTTAAGAFSFANVPFGKRSVAVYSDPAGASPLLGPVLFTLDRPQLELNESALDVDP